MKPARVRVLLAAAGVLLSASAVSPPAGRVMLRAGSASELTAVLDRARDLRRVGYAVTIEIGAGTYYLESPLVIDPALSGNASAPTVIRAAAGARPVLSGGRPLDDLVWRPVGNGVFAARISGPRFSTLSAGSIRLVRARYPNLGPGLLGGTSVDATSPARVARWRDPAGGVIHALHPSRWGGIDQLILGKNADGSLRLAPPVGNNRMAEPSLDKRYVENIREELDAPGEWYADFAAGWLYLMPPAGLDPARTRFVATRLETVLDVAGRAHRVVHDVELSGLAVRDTEPTFLKTTEPLLRSDWAFYRHGAVTIADAERVTIDDNDLSDLGGNAVVVSGHARGVAIRGNHIHHVGASGIAFVGLPSAVRSPLFDYRQDSDPALIDRRPGPKSSDFPADSVAEDNLIHDTGLWEKQSAGVEIAMAARISVVHNSIYRIPRAGINIGDGTWGGHRIVGNDVFATVLETGDHGAFNAWGRDRYWTADRARMNARLAADPALSGVDAVETTVLSHNRFQCDRGWDIDLDDGASNYLIEDNVLLSGGLKLREGFRRTARNNIVLNNGLHPHVWFAGSGDVVEHNILLAGHQPVGMKSWGTRVDDNLLPTAAALARARAAGTDAHSRAGDPRFVDAAASDYRVMRDSPALAVGFVPFPTQGFGVTSSRLRRLAKVPPVPVLVAQAAMAGRQETLLGMTVKSVETLGEQSATGLPDRAGVLVLAVAPGSPAAVAGIAPGDALVAVSAGKSGARQPVPTLLDLVSAVRATRWRGGLVIETYHNQQKVDRPIAFDIAEPPQ